MANKSSNLAVIDFLKVTKIYPPDIIALRDVSFTIKQGEIVFLTGMSGAGKTTLLKLICSLERPTRGMIEIMGRDLNQISSKELQQLRQLVGVAYQDFKLLPKYTVFQNIAMPMEVTYTPPKQIKERVEHLLEALNLTKKRNVYTSRLSRGEQQRVALARAAVNSPPLLLADEPTGNLDPATTELVVNLFEKLAASGTTMIIATHDQSIYQETNHRVLDIAQGVLN